MRTGSLLRRMDGKGASLLARGVASLLAGLVLAGPARPALADDAPLATMFDLSADEPAPKEIAFDVARALKKSKHVRYKDMDEALNLGGEELQVSSMKGADGLMKSGLAKLKAGNAAEAAEDFGDAVGNYLTAFAILPDGDVLARAMGMLGVAQLLSGDTKAAKPTFERSVQVDPRAELSLQEWPKAQAMYEKAKEAVNARAKVDFEVRTEPANARVYVNGRFMGLSPTYASSLAGEQFIAIYKHGYARKARIVQIAKSGEVLDETLEPARRKSAYDSIRARLAEIFDGAVEADDLTEAEGLVATTFAVALRATGTREKMKVQLALVNLSGRQVVHRVGKELRWESRDREAIDKLVDDLFKAPEVPITKAPEVKTRNALQTWWFWTIVGSVAVGSVAAFYLVGDEDPVPPKYKPGTGGLAIRF